VCDSVFCFFYFFQFPNGATVASIPRQIQTDFARLATLFLKTAASDINVTTPYYKKINLLYLLGDFKRPHSFPFVLVARGFFFSK
jgi:hypothetical protein